MRSQFVQGLPTEGPWTALGLRRGQFFAILGFSLAVFLFLDGPAWRHVRDAHFQRIVVSYAVIVPATWLALRWNGTSGLVPLLAASAAIAFVKLLLTAGLLVLLALSTG
jgi:hypothetical protein